MVDDSTLRAYSQASTADDLAFCYVAQDLNKEAAMFGAKAIEALIEQHERFTELLREIDDGRRCNADAVGRLDAGKIRAEAARIGTSLDHIKQLASEIALSRTDVAMVGRIGPQSHGLGLGTDAALQKDSQVVPEGLGPFSPGSTGKRSRDPTAGNAKGGYGAG